jgi:choloylglycine hydrolase
MKDGLKVYDNPYDVMTNEPPFPFHDYNVRCHMGLSAKEKEGAFLGEGRDIKPFAAGLGAYGLPGDASSPSRFLKAAFEVANDACVHDENECVAEVFNILGSVAMTDGSVANKNGGRDITRYSCCMSLQDASYYYRTYHSGRIIKVPLTKEAASAGRLSVSELLDEPAFYEAEAKTI